MNAIDELISPSLNGAQYNTISLQNNNAFLLLQFKQKPSIILLDCSKLQLGRGRLDDSVTAFRRRLEIFRQLSLPMLKTMDNIGRLTIVIENISAKTSIHQRYK